MKSLIISVTFLALCVPPALMAGEDLAVIVNKTNPADGLTKAQLKRIVLGEQSAWQSGKKVTVVLRSPGQSERDGVLHSVCGMSEDDFNQHLLHASFNGETAAAPKAISSGAAVRQLVSSIPGAIGFVLPSDVNDTVKVIAIDGLSAGQPGYKVKEGK